MLILILACRPGTAPDSAADSAPDSAATGDSAAGDTGAYDPCSPGKGAAELSKCVAFRFEASSESGATTDGQVQAGVFSPDDPVTLTGTVKNACNLPVTLPETAARDCTVRAFVVTEGGGEERWQESVCGPGGEDTVLDPGQGAASTWSYGPLPAGTHGLRVCWDWSDVPEIAFELVVQEGP